MPLPEPISAEVSALAAELARNPALSRRLVPFLLGDDSVEAPSPGLLRFLGWTALARALRPVVEAFAGWRDDERWLRSYCPTCGAGPAMGQIRRNGTGAPPPAVPVAAVAPAGDGAGRSAPSARTTRTGSRASTSRESPTSGLTTAPSAAATSRPTSARERSSLLLADWTSLHLDLLAHERGLERKATSLYDLDSLVET